MDLKSTPVSNSTRVRHVQAAAVPAAAVVDGLKSVVIKRQHPVVLPFFMGKLFVQDFMDVIKERRSEFTGYIYAVQSCFKR